jgi:hypothetical protein
VHLARTLLAAVAVLVTAPSASACVLAGPPPTPDQQVQKAAVAFTGTVTTSDPQFAGGFAMTVKVDRVLKGQVPDELQLVSGMTSCSAPLKAGERRAFAMKPTAPAPWDLNLYDLADATAFDALPLDVAFAPLAIRELTSTARRARVQIHVKARACTTLRARRVGTARRCPALAS